MHIKAPPLQAHPNAPAPERTAALLALVHAFTLILETFGRFVVSRFHVIGDATGSALNRRVVRAYRRLQHILALAATGKEPRQYAPRATHTRKTPAPRKLPRKFGWGCDMLGHHGNAYGSQLHHLLTQPDTIALLRAAPARTRMAVARAVRPILHMFAWPMPDVLQQAGPPRPRRKRPVTPKPRWPRGLKRPATHPYPMLPEDTPLRPWVRRTARAWNKTPQG